MFARIVFSAAAAGLIAGLVWSGLQSLAAVPIILQAETHESGAALPAHDHGAATAAPHAHDAVDAWAPSERVERTLYTAGGNVLTAVGFGLLLGAAYALRGGATWRQGLLWGLGGFVVFQLAPALGLPPEIPGTEAAPLGARQLWWLTTVVATGAGLALVVFRRDLVSRILGVGLVAAPHLIGAPQPEAHGGLAPEALQHAFVVTTLLTNAAFWLVLGALSALVFDRLGRDRSHALHAAA